jgi:hypothetical protein
VRDERLLIIRDHCHAHAGYMLIRWRPDAGHPVWSLDS